MEDLLTLTGCFLLCRSVIATLRTVSSLVTIYNSCEVSMHTLLQLELCDPFLIGRYSSTLDAHRIFLDGFCSVDRDLVIRLIAIW